MSSTIALAGNPNAGKTTLFNNLTGARQHVGNYPGITVDKKQGAFKVNGTKIHIVDLPGTYSLTAYSMEEVVARDFLLDEKPGIVIDIVDASNIKRNLYLTIQFLEMGIPICIALNMMDVAKKRGIKIDHEKLSKALEIPVIPTIARTGMGKSELMAMVHKHINENQKRPLLNISYGVDIDKALIDIEKIIIEHNFLKEKYTPRWIALKYFENDKQILDQGSNFNSSVSLQLKKIVEKVAIHLKKTLDTYPEAMIADHRYGYINSILQNGVLEYEGDKSRLYMSDKIDKVVTNRFMGPIIMVAIILGLYNFTFTYSEIPISLFESFFGWLGSIVENSLSDGLLKSLIISGVIDGAGGVLGFVPLIMFMFFGISILEDSGYLARVAFMMDRIFRVFGLHGSSVMPFIVSGGIAGGCAVPGVMASRTLKSRNERLATILTVPFMNCGAKLPAFSLLVAAFFAEHKALIMGLITFLAWIVALLVAKLLRVTIIKGEPTPFVMELPPYRFPTFKGLFIHTWERTWQYIKKAGTVILGISIIIWAMMTFPGLSGSDQQAYENQKTELINSVSIEISNEVKDYEKIKKLSVNAAALKGQLSRIDSKKAEAALKNSIAGRIGVSLETFSKAAGFDWRTNIALVGGFAAKEVIVSTLGTAYSLGEVDPEESKSLSKILASDPGWSPAVALSLIVFMMFYAPCFVTVICIAKEAGSYKWAVFSIVFNTVFAFLLSVIVYKVATIMGF